MAMERVPLTFLRMLPGIEGYSYKERLDRLDSFSLECRSLTDDLTEVCIIMRGIDSQNLFSKDRRV